MKTRIMSVTTDPNGTIPKMILDEMGVKTCQTNILLCEGILRKELEI